MNNRDLEIKRNDVARLFRHSSKIHRNCVRLNAGNTFPHEERKFIECMKLKQEGKEFLTEAEFERPFKARADIVVLDEGVVIEIQHSESNESIEEKKKTYPLPIKVVRV
jgi:hypothetical protein